jgi:hypothetical protein
MLILEKQAANESKLGRDYKELVRVDVLKLQFDDELLKMNRECVRVMFVLVRGRRDRVSGAVCACVW